jgi:type I restriction enzyme S subunit
MGSEGMGVWELPEGWGTAPLGDLVRIRSGFACAKKNLVPPEEGVAHLRPFNVDTSGRLDLSEVYYIPPDYKDNIEDYALEPGHVLFNNTNSVELVGKSALVTEPLECAFSNHIYRLTVKPKAAVRPEPAWLVLALRRLWAAGYFAERCNRWIGQAGFNSKKLTAVEIPLPHPDAPSRSLETQRRIVARIEELFARIEEARRLRAAADEDAERLMKSALAEALGEAESKGWPERKIEDIIVDKPQYGTSEKASEEPIGVPVLRMGNIVDGGISFDDLKYIKLPPEEEAKFSLNEGDILFNRTNSAELVGKTAVYPGGGRAIFASYLIRIVADPEQVIPHFISAYINSAFGRQYIEAVRTRAIGQANVNATKLRAMPIPVPSLSEQRHIVEYLNSVQTRVDDLKRAHGATVGELERLEQSILARAFRGEL